LKEKAIQIHPLVCSAFNADFDGDQMAIHVPLSDAAQKEAREIMLSSHNLLKPADGSPVVYASQDIVIGCYFLTMDKETSKGDGKIFGTYEEIHNAYNLGTIDLQAKIKYKLPEEKVRDGQVIIDTTAGRVIFNEIFPREMDFINNMTDSKTLKKLLGKVFEKFGQDETARVADAMKEIGFRFSTMSGTTFSVWDIIIPAKKKGNYH